MARILVVDDHESTRQHVCHLIQTRRDWEVCGEAVGGQEAVSKHSVLKPHITVIDFNMPLLNGLETSRQIPEETPSARILMLTVHVSHQLMEEAKKAGIKGFCSKDGVDCIFAAVEAILRGETYFIERPN